MADHSHIEWTEATWNPIAGCTVVSPGCTNCYAMRRVAPRLSANPATPHYAGTVKPSKAGPVWTGKIGIAADEVFMKPLRWKRPRMIFVNSTSDLFHEDVPDTVIDRVFAVMALSPQHTYQVLTKRAARMREYIGGSPAHHSPAAERIGYRIMEMMPDEEVSYPGHWAIAASALINGPTPNHPSVAWPRPDLWPLPNVWLGVSAERQIEAEERGHQLIHTPAAIRFASTEPMLGPIEWTSLCTGHYFIDALRGVKYHDAPEGVHSATEKCARLDWIIVGGESGDGARPMHPAWARQIRDQCASAQVPFFFKQWGDHRPLTKAEHGQACGATLIGTDPHDPDSYVLRVGKKAAGRLLDGVEHNFMPQPGVVPAL